MSTLAPLLASLPSPTVNSPRQTYSLSDIRMSFRFLDLPRELRNLVYDILSEECCNKPHIPCFLASCQQVYNEMQHYIQRGSWESNRIYIKPLFPLALNSISGPKGSRRARKTGGYSHWDLRALSSLSIVLQYDGIIDNPDVEKDCDQGVRELMLIEEDRVHTRQIPPKTPQQIDEELEQKTSSISRELRRNVGEVYRALHWKRDPMDVTFNIAVERNSRVGFTPRGCFKRGIFQHLRAYTRLPPRHELKAVAVSHDIYYGDHQREQQLKHAAAVAGWFNKRRTRWLARQEFLARRTDFLWDVRTLFGDLSPPDAPPVLENPSFQCRVCRAAFLSNNKLHQHIRAHNRYATTEDYQGHYEYWYGCSREEVYRNWYNGDYRQPYPLHVRRNADGQPIDNPNAKREVVDSHPQRLEWNADGW